MGSLKQLPFSQVENLTFAVYSDEEIEKLSVLAITNENSTTELGHVVENGIYDLRLGPTARTEEFCKTCNNTYYTCSGHCGHIELPFPVFNVFFIDVIKDLLHRICFSCFRFQVKASRGIVFTYESLLCSLGYVNQALEVSNAAFGFLACPNEAIEISVGVDDEESEKQPEETEGLVLALHKMLKKKVAHIKKNEEASSKKTSNSEAAALYIHRKFLDDTRPVKKKCMYCSYSLHNLQYTSSQLVMKQSKKSKDEDFEKKEDLVKDSQPYLTPKQAQEILRECYIRDGYILKHLYPFLKEAKTSHPTDLFFIKNLMVIPPRFRPMAKLGASLVIESEMSTLYKSVLRLAKCLRFLVQYKDTGLESIPEEVKYFVSEFKGSTVMEKCHSIWKMLQNVIDNILDAEINPSVRVVARGVRQIVEKKFGLFRQNLMGKRVNFSARSVAAPDPMLDVDEVGVPEEFALKLTYPVPVTPWNVAKLRKLVENGPLNYPGALFIEDQEGKKITLKAGDPQQRIAVASSLLTPTESCAPKVNAAKIVYRHLQNGDYVLMNRQPTLHKPSIQAHRARIMKKDRVLRMPYANCKAYNADFDGDELNLHFPQNEMTRSESEIIVTSRRQYLTQKDGSPLAGLIQDSIVSSVTLTVRGKFFGKEDYQQLVYVALSDQVRKLKLLKPAILKPQQLWSGKQVLSTIIMNLIQEQKAKPTFKFKTTVKVDLWQQSKNRVANTDLGRALDQMTESELVMRGGELLCGVIDKCAIGSTSHGLIHLCYELYGPNLACKLLTAVNRLCVAFLQWSGHTISLKEFVTTRLASRRRRKALNKLIKEAESEVSVRLGVPQGELQSHFETVHKSDNTNDSAALDAAYTAVLGPATSSITMDNEKRIIRNGLKNRMRMMVDTGAKGSKVNMNQMSSLFGSVAIDGKRMPLSVTGKSLPVFRSYDCDPRAGGYISTRFVTGMDPKSYFFLCIVGRDSLQHTAVKTANSGYMQRCLIKHLEGIKVEYDMTVRNSDGLVLQFEYGEDGMDVSKMPFMRNVDTMDIFAPNFAATIDSAEMDVIRKTKNAEVPQYKKKVKKYLKKVSTKERRSPFLNFSRNSKLDLDGIASEAVFSRLPKATSLLNKWNKLSHKEKSLYWSEENDSCKRVDPVASVFNGSLSVGAISESLEDLIENYYNKKYSVGVSSEKSSVLSKKEMKDSLYVKAFKSRVEPGEAVGAICAQAIGEPLTQMTLNTFHFAGRDELNVTLGVPRMIEILRVASEKIATPIMEVPFKQGMSQSIADKLKRTLTPVVLKDVLHKCSITTWLQRDSTIVRYCEITFELLPRNEYKHTFIVKPEGVLAYMEKVFFRKIIKEVKAAINRANLYASSNRSEGSKEADAGDEEKDDGEGPSSKAFGQCGLGDGDSSEEEDNVADEDVANAKRMTTKKEQDYSEDEEAINEQDQEAAQDQEDEAEVKKLLKGNLESKKEWIENETGAEVEEGYRQSSLKQKKGRETTEPSEYAMRTSFVKSTNSWIVGYDYDRSKNLWCKITLGLPIAEGRYDLSSIIQNLSETSLVHAVPGVKKALVVNKDDQLLLRTEGVNIHRMYSFEHILDVNKLYTNNIQLMAQRYGIEAAQRAIIKEICEVQSAYDIKVDFRHLSLLADYFTREGVYKACSRFALRSCASPIQKMSYETCFDFMQKALLGANCDDISSPSAKVMLGQPVEVGTNTMQILCNLKA